MFPDVAANTPATTTAEHDRVASGQRRVNLIWESTQAGVALGVTVALIYCEINHIVTQRLGDAFTLIVALYFVRTNHTKIGGVRSPDER